MHLTKMNPTLEYIYSYPKETKRIVSLTYKKLIKSRYSAVSYQLEGGVSLQE